MALPKATSPQGLGFHNPEDFSMRKGIFSMGLAVLLAACAASATTAMAAEMPVGIAQHQVQRVPTDATAHAIANLDQVAAETTRHTLQPAMPGAPSLVHMRGAVTITWPNLAPAMHRPETSGAGLQRWRT